MTPGRRAHERPCPRRGHRRQLGGRAGRRPRAHPDRHHCRPPLRRPRGPACRRVHRHRARCLALGRPAPARPRRAGPARRGRVAVVGLYAPGDEHAETRLRQLGVVHLLPADSSPVDIAAADVRGTGRSGRRRRRGGRRDRVEPAARGAARPTPHRPTPCRWSSPGPADWSRSGDRPGRRGAPPSPSTVAAELAASGVPTLLADADVYGGVVAQVLGFLDEAPGLAAAARLANNGQLDVAALAGRRTAGCPEPAGAHRHLPF